MKNKDLGPLKNLTCFTEEEPSPLDGADGGPPLNSCNGSFGGVPLDGRPPLKRGLEVFPIGTGPPSPMRGGEMENGNLGP